MIRFFVVRDQNIKAAKVDYFSGPQLLNLTDIEKLEREIFWKIFVFQKKIWEVILYLQK